MISACMTIIVSVLAGFKAKSKYRSTLFVKAGKYTNVAVWLLLFAIVMKGFTFFNYDDHDLGLISLVANLLLCMVFKQCCFDLSAIAYRIEISSLRTSQSDGTFNFKLNSLNQDETNHTSN